MKCEALEGSGKKSYERRPDQYHKARKTTPVTIYTVIIGEHYVGLRYQEPCTKETVRYLALRFSGQLQYATITPQ